MSTLSETEVQHVGDAGDGERFVAVHGASGYRVSNLGRITGKMGFALKPSPDRDGYPTIGINGKCRRIHQLVCTAFNGPKPTKAHQVNHIDGVKSNNAATNLEWVTVSENLKHAFRMGLLKPKRGVKSVNAKLTDDNIREIMATKGPRGCYAALAVKFGVTPSAINNARYGLSWKHVTAA